MQHLDDDTIGRVASWLSSQQEAAQAWRHVEQCPDCAARIEGAWAELSADTYVPPQKAEQAPDGDAPQANGQERSDPPKHSHITGAPLSRGTSVGRYVILDVLGAGGMGVVYAAYDPELNRRVALKLLRPRGGGDLTSQGRLLREAQAMAQISHPNVTAVYDVGMVGEQVFLAMELVAGETFGNWLSERKRSWREVLAVMIDAGRGLAAAHAAGLAHRDFKPENVLVGEDGRVRVTDFGLARLSEDPADVMTPDPTVAAVSSGSWLGSALTHAGGIVGTPLYMAPEQHLAKPPDTRSDQFSFCTTLYYGLFGERPFEPRELAAAARATEGTVNVIKPPPRQPRLPAWVKQALGRGLSLQPEQRFGSMEELLDCLSRPPAARRRARVALGGLVLVAFGGLVSREFVQQRKRCEGAEQRLVGVWDEPRRQAVRAAFRASGQFFADSTLAKVESFLDRRAHEWQAMHTEACEATAIRGEQSPAMLDLRMVCLNRRLSELQTVTDLFAKADGKVVESAATALENLTPLQGCADLAALTAAVRPPDNPVLRAQVDRLRQRLDGAKSFENAGKYPEGVKLAEEVVREAKLLPYRPIQAEALLQLGRLQQKSGDPRAAHATLDEAVWTAEASRHDEVGVHAMNPSRSCRGPRRGESRKATPGAAARPPCSSAWGTRGSSARIT